MSGLVELGATAAVAELRAGRVTPLELVEAAIERIERLDPLVNAVPIRCFDRARAHARSLMQGTAPAEPGRGWLGGLPIVVKDLFEVEGVRTTYGSPIFAEHVSEVTDLHVGQLEANGAIVLGKSNTPEFGAGANTFNEVFGATRNPWNTALTCGGSSGGSAVALATGMAWLADGSDLGGSLRTPAAFCGVVGLRPSIGRIMRGPASRRFQTLTVNGPMARDVADLALMLDAMSGTSLDDPLAAEAPAMSFAAAARMPPRLQRVGFSADLGGFVPVDPEIARLAGQAAARMAELGAAVIENRSPDFGPAREVFEVLRAAHFAAEKAPLLEAERDKLKPEVIWNIERGLALTADEIGWAERERSLIQARVAAYFREHDLLLCPAAIVPPFPVELRYLEALGEHRFPTYIDWVAVTYAITLSGCPALSLPCGFTEAGLPVGLQLVGPPQGEARLLAAARALEEVLAVGSARPIEPRSPLAGA
ncbi:MAG: amidase family protein [Geminicoccaceae bacterium]|nr:amidase family protein [Geminicoccaceae bacterium]